MYKRSSNPNSLDKVSMELSTIINGTDIFNSDVLYKISKFPISNLVEYKITTTSLNSNSVSKIVYGNFIYSWIINLFNPDLGLDNYAVGTSIKYPKLDELVEFIKNYGQDIKY